MRFKRGVDATGMNPAMIHVIDVSDFVWDKLGLGDCEGTSLNDGKHMKGSLHGAGRAIDLRIRDLTTEQVSKAYAELCSRLYNGFLFDVVLEHEPAPHIHIEFQPRALRSDSPFAVS